MALTSASYYATNEQNDEIRMTNDETKSEGQRSNESLILYLIIPSSFVLRHLVNIALVALVALEFFNVFVGLVDAFAALLLYDFAQHRVDILRHSLRVAAHEKVRAFRIDPFPNLRGIVIHPVLDINLFGLIA